MISDIFVIRLQRPAAQLCLVVAYFRESYEMLYLVVTPRSFRYRPDDTGGAAHSCAAGHTTYDN